MDPSENPNEDPDERKEPFPMLQSAIKKARLDEPPKTMSADAQQLAQQKTAEEFQRFKEMAMRRQQDEERREREKKERERVKKEQELKAQLSRPYRPKKPEVPKPKIVPTLLKHPEQTPEGDLIQTTPKKASGPKVWAVPQAPKKDYNQRVPPNPKKDMVRKALAMPPYTPPKKDGEPKDPSQSWRYYQK